MSPYLDASGDLVIPFDSDPKYHYWTGGQSVQETVKDLGGDVDKYTGEHEGEGMHVGVGDVWSKH